MAEAKKSFLEKAESAIDRGIGFFSPRAEAKRRMVRGGLRKLRSEKYAAAKTNRMTGSWSPVNTSINDVIGGSWDTITGRVRQLVRDFPYFARAVDILVDYSVGDGIRLQSKIRGKDGRLNKKLNQQVEDAFHFWADEADESAKGEA